MKATVTSTVRFVIDPEGELWFWNKSFCYQFWARYLDVYDEIRLLARARPCSEPPEGWQRATGPGVRAAAVPDFHSPFEMARWMTKTRRIMNATLADAPALILRVPCLLGDIVFWAICRSGRPYGVEVLGDPYDSLAPGASKMRLRAFYRWWLPKHLRRECQSASATAYVTACGLQRRYPPAPGAFTTHYSSVLLADSQIAQSPRRYEDEARPVQLIWVASLDHLQKAPQIVLDALAQCAREGLDVRLTIVGDGKHRIELEDLACRLGVKDRTRFLGNVSSRQAVQNELDRADLFVHPSFQDGLPRAMIEAMARGLPCIGSTIGGIPELLPPEDLVTPGDVEGLAEKIRAMVTDPQRMTRASARNLEKSKLYCDEVLRERRLAFYHQVAQITSEWLKKHNSAA